MDSIAKDCAQLHQPQSPGFLRADPGADLPLDSEAAWQAAVASMAANLARDGRAVRDLIHKKQIDHGKQKKEEKENKHEKLELLILDSVSAAMELSAATT